ncbi:MAG: hypothetical protein ABIH11_01255 [Candidatus Altiarchaeota archaeon]
MANIKIRLSDNANRPRESYVSESQSMDSVEHGEPMRYGLFKRQSGLIDINRPGTIVASISLGPHCANDGSRGFEFAKELFHKMMDADFIAESPFTVRPGRSHKDIFPAGEESPISLAVIGDGGFKGSTAMGDSEFGLAYIIDPAYVEGNIDSFTFTGSAADSSFPQKHILDVLHGTPQGMRMLEGSGIVLPDSAILDKKAVLSEAVVGVVAGIESGWWMPQEMKKRHDEGRKTLPLYSVRGDILWHQDFPEGLSNSRVIEMTRRY